MPTGIRFPLKDRPPHAEGYGDTYEETRTTVEMETGPDRVRNKMRSAPRLISVRWKFTQEEYQKFEVWWQEGILGGERLFDMQTIDDTEDVIWFTCTWVGEFQAEINSEDGGLQWWVSGTVRAEGPSFADRPAGTDELEGRASMEMRATGALLIIRALAGRAPVGITARGQLLAPPLHGRSTPVLIARGALFISNRRLRETAAGGGFRLREDGSIRLREGIE